MHLSSILSSLHLALLSTVSVTLATPTPPSSLSSHQPSLPLPVKVIHQYPPGTWIENLAIRSNGQILATVLTAPQLSLIDPSDPDNPILVHTFPGAGSVVGITELEPDIFYVGATKLTLSTFGGQNGTFVVWRVDMRHFSIQHKRPAVVTKVATFPKAILLNGITVLSHQKRLLLIADSLAGVVYRLNTRTGVSKIVLQDPLMSGNVSPFAPGVNGLNLCGDELYFTNSLLNILGRQLINPNGTPKANATVVTNVTGPDDFTLGPHGQFFIAQNGLDELSYAPRAGGNPVVLAGSKNSLSVAGPTAVRFGRGWSDRRSVYVSLSGGSTQYLTGNLTNGGGIVRVDVGGFL